METKGIRSLNGTVFEKMVRSGLNNLIINEKRVNDMNVFPVADGDTGRNMRMTLENGILNAESDVHFGRYAKSLSKGMLFGARGNSGVILSQIFKGISSELSRDGIVNPGELCEALTTGYRTAYDAVVKPVEGTILTVAREGVERIKQRVYGNITIQAELDLYIREMKKTLDKTPEMLSVLKDAGVVDSGGFGYVVIIEGMLKYLCGEEVNAEIREKNDCAIAAHVGFDENTPFTVGYCLEFLLQLKREKGYDGTFDREKFIEKIGVFGNSVVVVEENSVVKTHIHTFCPSDVIKAAEGYGDFVSFKLENMQIMHSGDVASGEKTAESAEGETAATATAVTGYKKDFGIIVCAEGDGTAEILRGLGADAVLPSVGGNVSAEEFLNAINKVGAKNTVIFPNDVNAVKAAEQAIRLSGRDGVTIIPAKSVTECYYALGMDMPDDAAETRIKCMTDGAKGVLTIGVATSVKDFGGKCKKGDKVAFVGREILATESTLILAAVNALRNVKDIGDKNAVLIFGGKNAADGEEIADAITREFPHLEAVYLYGGQSVYELIMGVI